jgi:4-diphosphocytidyl-2-C-methyl-D-erythritol kinase
LKAIAEVCISDTTVSTVTFESPAKVNLFLAITGRRADGFHTLVSVVAPLRWGDTLSVEPAEGFSLVCSDPAVPLDATNLILKAAHGFQKMTGLPHGAKFVLEKRIPIGAGLGGGSSNAATALQVLNQLTGGSLSLKQLSELAAEVGSDCPLFIHKGRHRPSAGGERKAVHRPQNFTFQAGIWYLDALGLCPPGCQGALELCADGGNGETANRLVSE